jgi:hypothetical protein
MRDLFENLLIHEVVTVAAAKRPNVQKWIDNGLVTAPPVVGKHRRFAASQTVEIILMTELTSLGVRPSAISTWLSHLAYPLLEYIDTCATRGDDGGIILTRDCVLRLFLVKGGNVINVVQLGDVVKTAHLPQYSLIMRCGSVFAAALRRARVVREAREARP